MERLRLVLVGTEGPVNLGMIARLADNFDVDELYLVAPKASIEEAREYAVRAAYRLDEAIIVGALEEALQDVSLSICTSAKAGGSILREPIPPWDAARLAVEARGVVALVMGRESVGLTRREIAMCNLLATIPASQKYPVLNLANATAIMLYEFYKARREPRGAGSPVSPRTIRILEAYARALSSLLVQDPIKRGDVVLSIRRIASKNISSKREVENLLYLLSKACRRIESCEEKVRSYLQPGP
ncbi:MAG: rRNA methyltransferase [Desulfurococcales archaeon]|nr:rRNA methyltransferase [Desulfurococcales archaeon]